MATSTPNLNLILPDYSDKADISVLNDNFQKIDEYCANGGVSNEDLQNAVKAANAWANATASAESVSADKEADVNLTEGDNSKNLHFSIPRGQPGVLISETEPTDPNVKVWIKPDGEPNELEQLKSDVSSLKDQIGNLNNDIYVATDYTIENGIGVAGKYYDKNGVLQTAKNLSTTGIIDVPYGAKPIYYKAYRNVDIPTILFFNSNMEVVGTVISENPPSYNNEYHDGYAYIPADAKYMEFSVTNTKPDQIIEVVYSKVDNSEERIKNLEKDPLYGLKISCTGDSITAATHSVPGFGYVEQIADAHGMTVDNKAIWGAVFPQSKMSDGKARGSIYDSIALMDESADVIVISGGINDAEYHADDAYWGHITPDYDEILDTETFCGALESICKAALQKWSGKPIIFVLEHRMTLNNTTYGAHFNDVQYPMMVEILQKWGIPFVDLYHDMPSLSYNLGYKEAYTTGDGTHPNIDGYAKFYVPRVYSKIKEVMSI